MCVRVITHRCMCAMRRIFFLKTLLNYFTAISLRYASLLPSCLPSTLPDNCDWPLELCVTRRLYVCVALLVDVCVTWLTTRDTTGWRIPIGCLKLKVIFRERATNYRALLLKMTWKDHVSYGSLSPCTVVPAVECVDSIGSIVRYIKYN